LIAPVLRRKTINSENHEIFPGFGRSRYIYIVASCLRCHRLLLFVRAMHVNCRGHECLDVKSLANEASCRALSESTVAV